MIESDPEVTGRQGEQEFPTLGHRLVGGHLQSQGHARRQMSLWRLPLGALWAQTGGETQGETPDTPPANATAQAMPGEFPWDPVPGVPQSTWISLEAESVDWKGIQL